MSAALDGVVRGSVGWKAPFSGRRPNAGAISVVPVATGSPGNGPSRIAGAATNRWLRPEGFGRFRRFMKRHRCAGFLVVWMLAGLVWGARAAAPPSAPTDFTITVTSLSSIALAWKDTSANELGFYLWYREGTTAEFTLLGSLPANATGTPLTGVAVATTYQFAVRAFNAGGYSDPVIATVTMPGITSRGYEPAVVGQGFSYAVTASSDGGAPDSLGWAGALPMGLVYDAATRQITGTPKEGGVFKSLMSVHYPAWGTLSNSLTLRVIFPPGPPIVAAPIPKQTLAVGGAPVTLPLSGFFADRDTEKAVRFASSKGTFDVALYATVTPQTVTNFLNYVNRGAYDNSIIHRTVANFIVQGGGFKPAPPDFTKIPTDPSPTNEPGVANLRGTVAMAKVGGNPNSATDQWFVNLNDNRANLDNQNGGFTAFGRVLGNGMAVADAIAALPRTNYTVKVDGANSTFEDWPMNTAPPPPAVMDQSKLVLITAATQIDPLTYTLMGDTSPGLVSGMISGTNLVLTPAATGFGGTTTLTLTAVDLDGMSVSQPVTVEVTSAYTTWLSQYTLQGAAASPGADPEGDARPNAVEFALVGSPVLSDADSTRPAGSVVSAGGNSYAAVTFKLRKNLSGAMVILKASSVVSQTGWTQVWTSNDLAGPQVLERVDQGDYWRLTVRDTTPFGANVRQRFLALSVQVPN